MSEFINNREYRQKILKEIILELHQGKAVDQVKARFEELIKGISPTEISEMEQALLMEGMPLGEIQKLCDVHAAVFKGSIEEIHRPQKPEEVPGHPVHTFKMENRQLEALIDKRIKPHLEDLRNTGSQDIIVKLIEDFKTLWEIDKHYSRKENLLFPFMEKYGITAPPKVMWGVDDEIRSAVKETLKALNNSGADRHKIVSMAEEASSRVIEMIFKEENILFPMVLETLAEDEWLQIQEASLEIGYCMVEPGSGWTPAKVNVEQKAKEEGAQPSNNGYVKFDAGLLLPEEINSMLNTLPVDITFVDKDGIVKYFTQGKDRIFARPKTIIGREVKNCHPPASVHIVEGIVEDLKSGKKEHEDFWIKMGPRYVYIRYFAVRDQNGEFLGTLEFTQDIKPIQEITGEKRLVENSSKYK